MMTKDYIPSRRAFVIINAYLLYQSNIRAIIFFCVVSFLSFYGGLWWPGALLAIVVGTIIFVRIIKLAVLYYKLDNDKYFESKRQFEFTYESIVEFEQNTDTETFHLTSITGFIKVYEHYIIDIENKLRICVPIETINNKDREWIENVLTKTISKKRIEENLNPKASPTFYLLCLLFPIPIIGAITGLVMIFFGIFQYKSKIIVGLGVLGIAITIFAFKYLLYQ